MILVFVGAGGSAAVDLVQYPTTVESCLSNIATSMGSAITVDTWVNICALILGLFGVFITLLYSARLARKQQDRQWEHEQERADAKDAHERTVLRSALTAELQAIRVVVRMSVENAKKGKKEGDFLSLKTYPEFSTEIYQAILPRIGMLSDAEIHAIAQAYKGLAIQTQRVKLIGENEDTGQVVIRRLQMDHYIDAMSAALKEIDTALKALAYHQD